MQALTPPPQSKPQPKVIAWEVTRRCELQCRHCRGAARDQQYEAEMSTEECKKVIDSIASFSSPILILTGGEPMTRPDIFELARYAADRGIYPVMAPCGHRITPETAKQMVDSGIQAISISLDGATPESHDAFRGVPGAYERTIKGLETAKAAGIKFQINTTVTKKNLKELPQILENVIKLGAMTWDLFFLVPTGRGSAIRDLEITPVDQERTLHWVYRMSQESPLRIKTTCAPHYARIQKQERKRRGQGSSPQPVGHHPGHPGQTGHVEKGKPTGHGHGHGGGADPDYVSGGCMAGDGFVFISHQGTLQTCGFLDINCGDLRKRKYDFREAYWESEVFNQVRNRELYQGKCGACEFLQFCGGCRARAHAHGSTYLGQEPGCIYVPESERKTNKPDRQKA